MDNNSSRLKTLIFLVVLLVLSISIFVTIKIAKYISNPDLFRQWIESFGVFSPVIYIGVTIAQILIPIIPGEPMELVAGYAFGSYKGTLLCLIAESIGSMIVVYLTTKYGHKLIEVFFSKEKIDSLKFLKTSNNKMILFSIIFMMPGTPKDLLCYFAGLTDINKKLLYLIISIGRIPSVITSTLIGGTIGDQNYLIASIVFAITACLSLFGIIAYNKMSSKQQR